MPTNYTSKQLTGKVSNVKSVELNIQFVEYLDFIFIFRYKF